MNVQFRQVIPASVAIVVLAFTAVAAQAQGTGGLRVTLGSESANLNASDDVAVSVRITNESGETVLVPKRVLPSQRATAGVFTVTRDGAPVDYVGALVKRGALTAGDFMKIGAGASLDFTVELSALYDFSASGVYNIQYDVESVPTPRGRQATTASAADRLAVQADAQSQDLASNTIALTITGDLSGDQAGKPRSRVEDALTRAPDVAPTYAASVSFVGCSNTRTTQVRSALTSAESYASNSLSYLNAGTRGSRYTTWFGTYNSSRYTKVRSNYSKISNAVSTKALVFDCSTCPGTEYADAYAYVYANQAYRVYLCGAFWAAPSTGTDSRAGTIIHEVSHFTVVADTDDLAYGQSAARSLAISNPSRAIRNADSHEYFAENTPARN
jgi:peptidyl-Lys metalloendopeptidase